MPFLKNPFAKSKPSITEPVRRISAEPVQSQTDQEENRRRMEMELNAARDARSKPEA